MPKSVDGLTWAEIDAMTWTQADAMQWGTTGGGGLGAEISCRPELSFDHSAGAFVWPAITFRLRSPD